MGITMCDGVNSHGICFKRNECYRHTAPANTYRQSYFVTAPFKVVVTSPDRITQECDEFWPNRNMNKL